MKKLTYFIILCSLFNACKSIQLEDYAIEKQHSELLPHLDMKVDIRSLETTYSLGGTSEEYYNTGTILTSSTDGLFAIGQYGDNTANHYSDKRIKDAITLFESNHRKNISTPTGDTYGTAVYKLPYGESGQRGLGWKILSIATLTIPNWFGMPASTGRSEVLVELEIRDCQDRIVKIYQGKGFNKTPAAFYHGYEANPIGGNNTIDGNQGMVRKSNIEAIKEALLEINSQLTQDPIDNEELSKACR